MRAELLAEINSKPRSTATLPATAPARDNAGPHDLEDVIRNAVKGIK
jgi:hypothetical protein